MAQLEHCRSLSRRDLLRVGGALGAAGALGLGAGPAQAAPFLAAGSRGPLSRMSPAPAVAWLRAAYDLSWREGPTPPQAARCYNYLALAMYEACVGEMPFHRSLGGQLTALGSMPVSPAPVDALTALAVSAHEVAAFVYASATPERKAALTALRDEQLSVRRGLVTPGTYRRSVAHGRAVASTLVAWIATDGWADIQGRTYTAPVGPDKWEHTPPNFSAVVEPYWSEVRPMVMRSAGEVRPVPHVPFSTDPASGFYAQAMATYNQSKVNTDETRAIASFWTDNPLRSGLPAGHWMLIAAQAVEQHGVMLDVALETFARLGVAAHDAFLSCWTSKFELNLIRPVTYVNRYIDASWSTFVNTPQFPEYTSGHSVSSCAAATVLADVLGELPVHDDSHRDRGMPARDFSTFRAAANEAAQSRIYGGIHFPMGIENGKPHGDQIGQLVIDRLRTRR